MRSAIQSRHRRELFLVGLIMLIVFCLIGGIYFLKSSRDETNIRHAQSIDTALPMITPLPEKLPLYSEVKWSEIAPTRIKVLNNNSTDNNIKIVELDGYKIESETIQPQSDQGMFPYFQKGVSYYEQILVSKGWKEDPLAVASGPESQQIGYEKEDHYFLFGYFPVYSGSGHQPENRIGFRLFIEYN